ncbi:MAG TPA: molybdopterin-synthase adenylyltransferase MoeB [Blastocatellia bacterium]|nr:molybdopterin-synthase adenylyltransferase MoeB [Blastocatellia bacterium]
MPTISIPTALRQYAGGEAAVSVQGTRIGEALASLTAQFPDLKKHLFDANGKLRNFVNIYVNDEDIRYQQHEDTPIKESDEISIIPSIAGGAATESEILARAADLPDLNKDEIARYSRHLIMPEVGMEGQRKLKQASMLLIGAGGLGSPLGLYLAAAGVGRLGLVDFDVVDHSNLQRQVLHGTKDVGRPKLQSAKDRLADLNPHVQLDGYEFALQADNALKIIQEYDVIIDGTDNFQTRYLANDASVLLGKPNVYGSIFRFDGQASVFYPKAGGPCYRCLYPEPPPPGLVPSCAEGGVLGILPGIIGVIQATEAIKLIIGQGEPLIGRLLLFDALKMKFKELKLRRNPECPLCGDQPTIKELIDYDQFCGIVPQAPAPKTDEASNWEITPVQLKERLDRGDRLTIIDVREPHEWQIANLEKYGSKLIPLGQFAGRIHELDPQEEIVVHCKMGGRSAKAYEALKNAGFTRIQNLKGGILSWADQVDQSMPKY